MNYKKTRFLSLSISTCLLFINILNGFSQTTNKQATQEPASHSFENIYIHWSIALDKARISNGIPVGDFNLFKRFSEKALDSLRGDFMNRIGDKEVTLTNAAKYESVIKYAIIALYNKYEVIKLHYPSSVEEFKNTKSKFVPSVCDSACNNIDFENGTLSGWNAYYGFNNSSTNFDITNVTGGTAGAVIHAANDTLTSTAGYFVPASMGIGPNPRPDYQVNITSGTRGDALVPAIPVVSPFGGRYSVMLGDSTEINYGAAILSQTFLVGASNTNFTYQYAVFLANPYHLYYHQPFFNVAVLDQAGDTIPYCGEYNVVSGNGTQAFDSIVYYDAFANETFPVYYKNWTIVNVPLTHYIGQCVTIIFEVADCSQGGHFGYAYIDASCSPLNVLSSSEVFCGQDSITLTGPSGEGGYHWTGPPGGIISSDTSRIINVDSTGTYTCVVTPFTGASCNDTLSITIGRKPGPPPKPNFAADTACAGMPTIFTNHSNPLGGGSFYWDFYNTGTFEDSTVNPTWIYNLPGIYTVKLEEEYNGCGMDTSIQIVVDSTVNSSFIADTVCAKDTMFFINTSTGAILYTWNFGDPSSGSNNASSIISPYHIYTSSGNYSVTLTGNNSGHCSDPITKLVVVLPNITARITGNNNICAGDSATITATGGNIYLWNTGATSPSITVDTNITTTFSIQISNGRCYLDTTYTLIVKPTGTGSISGKGSVCLNDTVILTATGGGTYLWNTGATSSSISIPVTSFKDSLYSVIISNGDSCTTIHKRINIDSISGFGCCSETINSGDTVVLNGNGSISYYWIPSTGLSCDSCPDPTASPTVTTTYTLISVTNAGCIANSLVAITVDIPCLDFVVPNVFTPNGDGIDDTYLVKVKFMSEYKISIFNRWGQEVFYSENSNSPWDGKVNGSIAPAGVYYYIIQATCEDGNYFEKNGFLQLIR
jgi:gliding motility-associated-like protein